MLRSLGVAEQPLRKPLTKRAGRGSTGRILPAAALGEPGPSAAALTATAGQQPDWWDSVQVGLRVPAGSGGEQPPSWEVPCLRRVFLDAFFPDGVTEKRRLSSRNDRPDMRDLGGGMRARGPGEQR